MSGGTRRCWLSAKTVIGVLLVAGVVALVASGAIRSLNGPTLRALVRDSGALGPLGFVLAFAALQPVGFSAHVFVITAGLVWDPIPAFGFAWVGALGATATSFAFARWIGRNWVQERLPDKLESYDERLAARGLRTVIVLRLLFYTFAPMQLMLGVSRVRFRDALTGSALGLVPMMLVEVTMSAGLSAWLGID